MRNLTLLAVLVLILVVFAANFASGKVVKLYVSPKGSDNNPGTLAKPFRSITRARDVIRDLKKSDGSNVFTVILRKGRYYLTDTVNLTAEDSGQDGSPITYTNYPGEVPVIVGGTRVQGWSPYKSGILKASMPSIKNVNPTEFEVTENGVPAVLARSPNEGWFRLESPTIEPFWSFCYKPGEINPAKWNVTQLQVHLIMMGTYFSEHIPIVKVDARERRLFTQFKMRDKFYNPIAGKTYTVENALELLDTPGEYFADHKTGILYYYPLSKSTKTFIVETSVLKPVISIKSDSNENPVKNIVISGLCFQGGQNQIETMFAEKITIRDCRLLNAAQDSIKLLAGSSNVTVTGCEIANVGVNGIRFQGTFPDPKTGKKMAAAEYNLIHNNYIHQIGRLSISGNGIYMVNAANRNTISNNLITDTTKSGIMMFSMWDIPREWGVMNDNVIRKNQLARCVTQGWDGGAFYIGATTDNNTFENNRVCDAWSFFNATWPQPEDRPDDVCSVDFDPGLTYNTYIRNNLFYGANASTFENGRFEDETLLSNNYFETLDQPGQLMFKGVWTDITKVDPKPFDISKINNDIGLTADYKYPHPQEADRPVVFPFKCGFEGTISPFYLLRYNNGMRFEYLSNSPTKDGKYAFKIDKDVCYIRYRHPSLINKRVSIWMYDDPVKKKAKCAAKLIGQNGSSAAIGVDGSGKYIGIAGDKIIASKVDRKAGWHELVFDFTSHPERGCAMSIDGWACGEAPALTKFEAIEIGDPDFGSDSTGLCFDSLSIE